MGLLQCIPAPYCSDELEERKGWEIPAISDGVYDDEERWGGGHGKGL